MPWYYAGLDAKPVGPISLEELHARRLVGTVLPETYVIEYTGQPSEPREWKRYRDMFPATPSQPPPAPPVLPPPPPIQPHPLFPSAAPVPTQSSSVPPPGPHHPNASLGTGNPWCTWGFGLGLASLILLLPSCGLTAFVALPAFFVSIIGLVQVHRHPGQTGRNLAVGGLACSILALLITVIVAAVAIPMIIKERTQTTTEQSTNDSE